MSGYTRIDLPHHTREQATQIMRDALAILEECEVPEDLRPAALVAAVRLLGPKEVFLEPSSPVLASLGPIRA